MNNTDKTMVIFRESRKGFDKTDVSCYIEEMNIRFEEAQCVLRSQLSDMTDKIKQAESLKLELESLRESYSLLKADYDAAVARCGGLTETIKEKDEEIRLLKENAAAAQALREEQAAKESVIQDISTKLGNLLVKAQLDADAIISSASEEAGKKLSDAANEANSLKDDANIAARLMIDRVKKRLEALTDEYINQLSQFSLNAIKSYDEILFNMKLKFKDMQFNMEESVLGIADDIDRFVS